MGFLKKQKNKGIFVSFCPGLEGECKKTKGLLALPCSTSAKTGSADSSIAVIYLNKCCLSDKPPGRAARDSTSVLNYWPWRTSRAVTFLGAHKKGIHSQYELWSN